MFRPRVIPVLLLKSAGLYKTVRFSNPRYVGDPINVVRIFNEKEVDEIILLDIDASKTGRPPDLDLIRQIVRECFMPVCYGGGISTLDEIRQLFRIGVEKISLNTAIRRDPGLVRAAAKSFGSQAVVASIDVKRALLGSPKVFDHVAGASIDATFRGYLEQTEQLGVGELLVTSVDRDGTMNGYDEELVRFATSCVSIPVVACGGAGCLADLAKVIQFANASAAAAGSFFVFHGKHRAVLVTYPEPDALESLFRKSP